MMIKKPNKYYLSLENQIEPRTQSISKELIKFDYKFQKTIVDVKKHNVN
jgi:hypothetical protein